MANEKVYTCEKHGKIGNQAFTIGVFDEHRCYKQKSLCGLCHFEFLQANCGEAIEVAPEVPAKKEQSRIITRGVIN